MEKLEREVYEKLVDEVDALTLSPSQRASAVWEVLRTNELAKFDTWDILCFCAWFISYMIPEFPVLGGYAKWINVKVHQIHYQNGESLGLYKRDGIRKLDNSSKEGTSLLGDNSKK